MFFALLTVFEFIYYYFLPFLKLRSSDFSRITLIFFPFLESFRLVPREQSPDYHTPFLMSPPLDQVMLNSVATLPWLYAGCDWKKYAGGARYNGSLRGELPHGNGILICSTGDVWWGNFSDGVPHGKCTLRYPQGGCVVAHYVNGELNRNKSCTVYDDEGNRVFSRNAAKKSSAVSPKRKSRAVALKN